MTRNDVPVYKSWPRNIKEAQSPKLFSIIDMILPVGVIVAGMKP